MRVNIFGITSTAMLKKNKLLDLGDSKAPADTNKETNTVPKPLL